MDPVQAYQEAVGKLNEAKGTAQRVARVVMDGAQALVRWEETVVSNISGGGYPPEVALRPAPGINAREWPTAETIHNALVAVHEARFAARRAWDVIPQERRGALVPPS